ncbi:MAG: PEGA domain-containing protein, partial [Thermococci archaeon]|nr:PEGA domain-containing protein [Thermococci archaeon]
MKSIERIGNVRSIKAILLVLLVLGGVTGFGSIVGAQNGSQASTQKFLFPAWLNEYLAGTGAHPSDVVVSPQMAVLVGTAYPKMVNGAPYGKPYSWVMGLTGHGNVVWGHSFSDALLTGVVKTGDGYVAVGKTHEWVNGASPAVNTWVVKLASNGSVKWQEALGPNVGMPAGVASDGSNVFVAGTATGEPWFVVLNSTGQIVWQKVGSGKENYGVSAVAKVPASGAYVVGGYETSGMWVNGATGSIKPWVAAIDSNGNIVWQETLNLNNSLVSKVYVTPNGNVLVMGTTPKGSWIVCLSPSGKFLWGKEYTGIELSAATFLSTGSMVLVGSMDGKAVELIVPSGGNATVYSLGFTATAAGAVGNGVLVAGFGKDGAYVEFSIAGTGSSLNVSVNSSVLNVSTASTAMKLVNGSYTLVNTSINPKKMTASYSSVWDQKTYGLLNVETSPSDAAVHVDGQFAGRTPVYYYVKSGTHKLIITKLNYAEVNENVTVSADQMVQKKAVLLPGGYIEVTSVPEGAAVYVDGQFIGDTPIQNYSIPIGFHEITIKKPGYVTVTKFITVSAGSTTNIKQYLLLAGYLRVITKPKGAAVYI